MTKPPWFSFAIPNAAEGVARLVDFGNSLSYFDYDFLTTDSEAMLWDFRAVGSDLANAVDQVAEDQRLSV